MDAHGIQSTSGYASVTESSSGADGVAGARSGSTGGDPFEVVLNAAQGDARAMAARDVLTALPAPIVYSLRDGAGSPSDSVDRLFEVLHDGSFKVPDGPLGAPGSLIASTARAAVLFDSPSEMWQAMRELTGAAAAPTSVPTAAAGATHTGGAAAGAPTALEPFDVSLRARARSIVGEPALAGQVEWWQAALRFLLGRRLEA